MISTRENLLIRPWQQRKYQYHKRKVLSATPVIDTRSPPFRGHVAVKLKKRQKEHERSQKIERDNLILLQRLNYIMSTHWTDNYLPPQPNFLSRVGVYRPTDSGIDMDDSARSDFDFQDSEASLDTKQKCRKLKCVACSPHKFTEKLTIPEERVPWEPDRKQFRKRSRSVPPKKSPVPLPTITEKPKSASSSDETTKSQHAKKEERAKTGLTRKKEEKLLTSDLIKDTFIPLDVMKKQPNSISLSRGSLKLSVNFPSDTIVNFEKKRIGTNLCRCLRNISLKA